MTQGFHEVKYVVVGLAGASCFSLGNKDIGIPPLNSAFWYSGEALEIGRCERRFLALTKSPTMVRSLNTCARNYAE